MIRLSILKDKNGNYKGIKADGHAGFEDIGKDIVWSAVSVLLINTVNSIEKFTASRPIVNDMAQMEFYFKDTPDEKAVLLMDSLVLGLYGIQKEYGKKYLKIKIKEV